MDIKKKTNVTIMSTNLNVSILNSFSDYHIFHNKIDLKEIKNNKKVIFFNSLHMLSKDNQNKLIKYLKDNNIDFIIITNNVEHCLLTDYLIIINEEKIIAEGKTLLLLKESKLLKRLGFNLPFLVDLSLMLKDYNMIDDIYLSTDDLVGAIWN